MSARVPWSSLLFAAVGFGRPHSLADWEYVLWPLPYAEPSRGCRGGMKLDQDIARLVAQVEQLSEDRIARNARIRKLEDKMSSVAAEMDRAADLDERDHDRGVTRFDARRWADELRAAVNEIR